MRQSRFCFLIAALLIAGAAPRAAAQGFRAVTSADGMDVWAVGDAGSVYRSLTGGTSWASYPLASADHSGVAARGGRVWITALDGRLWTSTDHGRGRSVCAFSPGSSLPVPNS